MSRKGFQECIWPLRSKLFRFAASIVRDRAEAEDVVQEVLIKIWRQWDRMQDVENPEAWSMRLTRNLSIDKMRSKHRRTEPIEGLYHLQQEDPSPHDSVVTEETFRHVRDMMHNLPDKQRMVMHLRDIEGHSYQEICEALGLSMSQVKVNLFRARKQLREKLQKTASYGSNND